MTVPSDSEKGRLVFVTPIDGRILFYRRDREIFGFLSNFYPSLIVLNGEGWPTVEHYYQAQKSTNSDYQHAVRSAPTPGAAKRLGTDPALPRSRSARSWFRRNDARFNDDWQDRKLDVMRVAVMAKFFQNAELGRLLVETGAAEIVEDSALDDFWGVGPAGNGTNWLGRILMEVRTAIASQGGPLDR